VNKAIIYLFLNYW